MNKTEDENTYTTRTNKKIFNYEEAISDDNNINNTPTEKEDDFLFLDRNNKNSISKKNIEKLKKKKRKQEKQKRKEIEKEQQNLKRNQYNRIKNKTQKPKKNNPIIKILIALIAIAVLCMLLMMSPILHIKEIKVENNEKISKQEITSLLRIGTNTNIFKENNSKIKEKLSENPYIDIDNTEIKRLLPSTLLIHIQERKVEYLFGFANSFAYVDKDGNILEISPTNIEGKIKITGYQTQNDEIKQGNKICENDLKNLSEIKQIINVASNYDLSQKITSVSIEDTNDLVLYMESEKKKVHIGDTTGLDTKMLYIKAILEKEKDNAGEIYVNMNLNKKNAYFKQTI